MVILISDIPISKSSGLHEHLAGFHMKPYVCLYHLEDGQEEEDWKKDGRQDIVPRNLEALHKGILMRMGDKSNIVNAGYCVIIGTP